MKIKIWCERCNGIGHLYIVDGETRCLNCDGYGFIEKDFLELDPDQTLPQNLMGKKFFKLGSYEQSQQDMLAAGWRKVK